MARQHDNGNFKQPDCDAVRSVREQVMNRLRVLLLGPDCHPTHQSIPFVTYSHAAALAYLHDVTLVAGAHVENDLRRAAAPFRAIEIVPMPLLDRMRAFGMRKISPDSMVRTALDYPYSIAFEWHAWRQFRRRIVAGDYDVVLRLVPMAAVLPSPFASFLRKGPIPFVIGPLQGGLPWPPGFSQLESQREWIANLRDFYRFMPFSRSTYRHATAIIVASSQTYSEFPAYTDKLFFIPEPGIDLSVCSSDTRRPEPGAKLELIFVGGLVPRKACDLALRGAAELLRSDVARFTVLGDGPERQRLEELVRSLGIEKAVTFRGWVGHEEVFSRLRSADLFVFPSLRDNGAGVVFQALACGAVPVVADFGGPGDIVTPEVGYKVPVTNEADLVSHLDRVLKELAGNRDLLKGLRERGMSYAKENLTWDAKAQRTTQVLNWAVRRAPKPVLLPPVRGGGRPGTEKPRYA
jgi:glycosyltransferase involved in cell wall biosynthesis